MLSINFLFFRKSNYGILLVTLFSSLFFVQCKEQEKVMPPATLTSISPKTGQPGTVVKIRGNNFSKTLSENTVMFNGVKAEITSSYDTLLKVKVPSGGSSGPVEISVRTQKLIGTDFKYYNILLLWRQLLLSGLLERWCHY